MHGRPQENGGASRSILALSPYSLRSFSCGRLALQEKKLTENDFKRYQYSIYLGSSAPPEGDALFSTNFSILNGGSNEKVPQMWFR